MWKSCFTGSGDNIKNCGEKLSRIILKKGETQEEKYEILKKNLKAKGLVRYFYLIKYWYWYRTGTL